MEKIIEKLKDGIAEAINQQDDLDAASWGYQEGILITANEAKAVLEALKALKISSNPVLSDSSFCKCNWTLNDKDELQGQICIHCKKIIAK